MRCQLPVRGTKPKLKQLKNLLQFQNYQMGTLLEKNIEQSSLVSDCFLNSLKMIVILHFGTDTENFWKAELNVSKNFERL